MFVEPTPVDCRQQTSLVSACAAEWFGLFHTRPYLNLNKRAFAEIQAGLTYQTMHAMSAPWSTNATPFDVPPTAAARQCASHHAPCTRPNPTIVIFVPSAQSSLISTFDFGSERKKEILILFSPL